MNVAYFQRSMIEGRGAKCMNPIGLYIAPSIMFVALFSYHDARCTMHDAILS